ncbi:protein of unknown function [Tenacibaculum maritimum NCIMB 2154]|uniref:Uncharacterized protein n=1 Tax=Tenacibaculum maritimum NCIMB 2154 TaxID=1349785 RepID=A0A2H1E6G6_9FLAO|nr:protein of unknown function [Tenacibaculum maritimum NCIMB 2154]
MYLFTLIYLFLLSSPYLTESILYAIELAMTRITIAAFARKLVRVFIFY